MYGFLRSQKTPSGQDLGSEYNISGTLALPRVEAVFLGYDFKAVVVSGIFAFWEFRFRV